MAIGFSPNYNEVFPYNDISDKEALVLALEASKILEWNIRVISKSGFIAFSGFSMSSWGERIKIIIKSKTIEIHSECTGNQFIDWGKNKKNIENFIDCFNEISNNYSENDLNSIYEVSKKDFVKNINYFDEKLPLATKEKINSLLSLFKPIEGYYITPILININVGIFILMAISGVNILRPESQSLINWGANFRPMVLEGEYWRLLSSCFIHGGIIHLLFNMYALLYIGILLEPYLGKLLFLMAYLLTGLCGSVVSVYWHEFTISVGASGAIFGMYGVFLAMLTTKLIEKTERKTLLISIAVFVIYNLLYGLKGGIDNSAHLGGLICGIIIGYSLYPSFINSQKINLRKFTIIFLFVIILIFSFFIIDNLPNNFVVYNNTMKQFTQNELKGIEIIKKMYNSSDNIRLTQFKDEGFHCWDRNLELLDELEEISLPKQLTYMLPKLRKYCDLRIKYNDVVYKAILEKTDKYDSEIELYNNQIEELLKEILANAN